MNNFNEILAEVFKLSPAIDCFFDFKAMDYFAERLRHPVFVIVTDDPVWAKGQIPPGFRPVFTGKMTQIADRFLGVGNVKIFGYNEFWQKLMMPLFRFLQRVSCRLGGIGLGCSCKLQLHNLVKVSFDCSDHYIDNFEHIMI